MTKERFIPLLPAPQAVQSHLRLKIHLTARARSIHKRGRLGSTSSMAGNGSNAAVGLASRQPIEDKTEMGLLVLPAQHHSVGRLGMARSRLGLGTITGRHRHPEHSRRSQEQAELRDESYAFRR